MAEWFFDKYNEFIKQDNRNGRIDSQVSSESLTKRCECFLPTELIKNKRILDLGCCIGSMGHWCLTNGASFYCGVEVQSDYTNVANALLSRYHDKHKFTIVCEDIVSFIEKINEKFDIVIFIGVLYSFTDIFSIIKKITNVCTESVIIDSMNPSFYLGNKTVIEIVNNQKINNSSNITFVYSGVGCRPTESAVQLIFSMYGFSNFKKLKPNQFDTAHDPYNDLNLSPNKPAEPSRFAFIFTKGEGSSKIFDLETILKTEDKSKTDFLQEPVFIKPNIWQFDESVAKRFKQEALNNIPDYIKVVSLSIQTILQNFDKNASIIDIGSAIGFTVDKLLDAGFVNAYGLEKSKDMIKQSAHKERIYYGDYITHNWDIIIANWTLHFIKERREFITSIFNNLNPNGLFILTDKMDSDSETKNKYVKFKIDRGLSFSEIEAKTKSLEGVLETKSLNWYLETLKLIGFKDIQVINSRLMFKTISCRK